MIATLEGGGRRRWLVRGVLCVSLLVVNLDTTILNVALPTVARDLHASSSELQWIVDAYAVVFAGLLLSFGSLGDRVGRKKVFAAGLGLFAAGSAGAAFSATPAHLIAARAFMGIGAAAITPSTLSILTNVFTDERARAQAIGIWSGTTGIGVALGPIAGGWRIAHYFWGSVFLVNVPIAAGGLLACLLVVPESADAQRARPDLTGAVLSTLGLGSLLWAIIQAPARSWSSTPVLAALGVAAALLGSFAVWERRCPHPMLELPLFASRRFSAAMVAMALVIFSLMGLLFVLTQLLQFVLGYSAFGTGLRIGPTALVILVATPLSVAAARWVRTKVPVAVGMVAVAASLALLSRTSIATTYGSVLPVFLLLGVGVGLRFAPATEAVMGSMHRDRAGIGAVTNGTALQIGGALGVGVLGSLLNARYRGQLTPSWLLGGSQRLPRTRS